MSTYAPGTIALATVRGVPDVRVMRRGLKIGMYDWAHSTEQTGYSCSHDDEVTDIRPLVVLDLDECLRGLPLNALVHALRGKANGPTSLFSLVAGQIEAQTKPPKPAEPTDPSARAIDGDGDVWAAHDGKWYCLTRHGVPLAWPDLVANYAPLEIRP